MSSRIRAAFTAPTVFLSLLLLFPPGMAAQSRERVIYAFYGSSGDCAHPSDTLTADGAGNFYGATGNGGAYSEGCVFELSPSPDGAWTEAVLHSFSGPDGSGYAAAVVFDALGNLYGTAGGGAYSGGVAYELSLSGGGTWTETVLYNFGNGNDGSGPGGNLVFDSAGNLYGTTEGGGTHNDGTVFRLTPGPTGWTESILYSFTGHIYGPDGNSPVGGLVMDKQGNLYGVTKFGGTKGGYGTVYELRPKNGGYVESLIHSFDGYDGWEPTSGLTMDSSGNLYGTTSAGGTVGYGTIFQLTRGSKGQWTVNVLRSLDGNDGSSAVGPVAIDRAGNVYAAAQFGGLSNTNGGSVFSLTRRGDGSWTETLLHLFDFISPNGSDGQSPYAGVILYRGQLFGTTLSGGVNDDGIVFSISPCADTPTADACPLQ
jgi:uncharacterized repeat protein (TIGR03803 family)